MSPIRRWSVPLLVAVVVLPLGVSQAQFSRADTLRGAWNTPGRSWWDVTYYHLDVRVNPVDSSLSGSTTIVYRATAPGREMQIDLKAPLQIDSVVQSGRLLRWRDDGAAHFVSGMTNNRSGPDAITVFYSGHPTIAPRPPWDGGVSWSTDSLGRAWVVTTDQGVGASIWWPNKDTQSDEPDSLRVTVHLPAEVGTYVGPGRLESDTTAGGWTTRTWFVNDPINNYAIALNLGHYVHWHETYDGEAGPLTLDFFPLDYHEAAARRQWVQARPMMACFEHWFGPYPWYTDGYKLIDVTYPGMEHQSAVTYGNGFANGYGGRDGSGTGLGLEWDFIIVHESAHEWWGNSITTPDLADMWVHESFANYAENLFEECRSGKAAGARYVIGTRKGIRNDRPVIPAYGVNAQGSGDMYPKGGNMLHTIRQIVGDDARWREILRGLQLTFRHRVTTGAEVQAYISAHAGIDLSKVFEQYLTTTDIPSLEHERTATGVRYRWQHVVPGFDMPVDVVTAPGTVQRLHPNTTWQELALPVEGTFIVDENYYVTSQAN
ncbi:MAG: M1 family metallopeptidase [Gemmatimonadota bacterium]